MAKPSLDMLNAFWKDLHNTRRWKAYQGARRTMVKDVYARYRTALSQARPFAIDDRALKVAYKLSLEKPETVARRLMLARLPFPKTWIEFDFREKLKLSEAEGTSPGVEPDTPVRIGYLLEESPNDPQIWAVTTVSMPDPDHADEDSIAEMAVVVWMVDTLNRQPPYQVGPFKQLKREITNDLIRDDHARDSSSFPTLRHLGWGYTSTTPPAPGINPQRVMAVPEVLESSINLAVNPMIQGVMDMMDTAGHSIPKLIMDSAVEQRGDVRMLVAILSLINEVPIIKEVRRPSGKVSMGGVIKPFLQTTTVKIDIPTKRYMTVVRGLLRNAQNRAKARHEVRGHWRTIVHKKAHERVVKDAGGGLTRIMIHEGELERVWVESHERGDASVGYVKHNYIVDKGLGQGH